jgi:hypothetical protein
MTCIERSSLWRAECVIKPPRNLGVWLDSLQGADCGPVASAPQDWS